MSCDDTKGGLKEAIEELKLKTDELTVLARNPADKTDEGSHQLLQCVVHFHVVRLRAQGSIPVGIHSFAVLSAMCANVYVCVCMFVFVYACMYD